MVLIQKLDLAFFAKLLTVFIIQLTEPAIHAALDFHFDLDEGKSKDKKILYKHIRNMLMKENDLLFQKLALLLHDSDFQNATLQF